MNIKTQALDMCTNFRCTLNHKFTSALLMKKTISEKQVKTFRAINCTCSSYCSITKFTLQCRSRACHCDKCYKENIQKPPCRRISVQHPFYGLFPSTFSVIVLHFPFSFVSNSFTCIQFIAIKLTNKFNVRTILQIANGNWRKSKPTQKTHKMLQSIESHSPSSHHKNCTRHFFLIFFFFSFCFAMHCAPFPIEMAYKKRTISNTKSRLISWHDNDKKRRRRC